MVYRTMSDSVADEVRSRILRGDLEAGTRLKERELAQELGVSATPVRDALQRLSEEGLVSIVPQKGASVRELTLEDAIEMTEFRELIEAFAFRKVAPEITDEDLAHLTALNRSYVGACDARDYDALVQADMAFHDYVVERAGNGRIAECSRRLSLQMIYYRIDPDLITTAELPLLRDHHEPLIAALAGRDPDAAEAALRAHVRKKHEDFTNWARALTEQREGLVASHQAGG